MVAITTQQQQQCGIEDCVHVQVVDCRMMTNSKKTFQMNSLNVIGFL